MSKSMDKLKSHPDYPNVSNDVLKEYVTERLEELKADKEWIDNELAMLREELGEANETT